MTNENIRSTVRTLFEHGKTKKYIARLLNINIKTVRSILSSLVDRPKERSDRIKIEEELLFSLHTRCQGYIQRMQEVLAEEYNIQIGYSTLSRLIREKRIGKPVKGRCCDYPDIPGDEMQHDTSLYYVELLGKRTKAIASGLYFRYSKMRYVKFYPFFKRFSMKCFFHEALSYFGYSARVCIIDNTNLAVLYGTGERAVFHPAMLALSNSFGFQWKAHRIKLANRKAGKERNFFTLETNFFPGRSFKSFSDLNSQAFEWATKRFAYRPQSKSHLIPAELFNLEKPYLVKLPDYIMPPYEQHQRGIDRAGYIAFNGNYYWIPESEEGVKNKNEVKVIEYEQKIDIYQNHKKLISYQLPDWNVKNQDFYPPDLKKNLPNRQPGLKGAV